MLNHKICTEIAHVAHATGIEPEALMAVVEIESSGKTYARVNHKLEPLIRFEGHYFYKRLKEQKRAIAVKKGLAHPKAGAVKNSPYQSRRWLMLNRAIKIHRQAALCATSWGVGQVMGSHWHWLGFGSVDALVTLARSGLKGQIKLMVRFITKAGLINTLNGHKWAKFARQYNGPAYRKNRYDEKLKAAYGRYKSTKRCNDFLSFGCKSGNVQRLQKALNDRGAGLKLDGSFGIKTREAVEYFQRNNGLRVDGIVGYIAYVI
jgi:hypothetical protein